MSDVLLEAKGVGKHFGGVHAVDDVSLQVRAGSIYAIIGPNGAGKTTFFNTLSGFYFPDAGSVSFKGADVTRAPSYTRVRMGMGRTFQTSSVFPELTVHENLAVGIQSAGNLSFRFRTLSRAQRTALDEKIDRLLGFVGLAAVAHRPLAELAHGSQRLCEIAMSLSTDPTLVLLDEPMAGLAQAETSRIVGVIRKLHAELGLTVLFVEHNMRVVLSLAQQIMVLDRGRVLAEGTPSEISTNPAVREAYIGKEVTEHV
ncbi:MAG: ABC transporter ATP-binding protein [Vulcanimicrobiaceae bacterium]